MYPIHEKPAASFTFDRLDRLWARYPQYHERTTFSTMEALLEEHASYREVFDEEVRDEYMEKGYDRFLINLSWSDLAYRYETRRLIETTEVPERNPYADAFMEQFMPLDQLIASFEAYIPFIHSKRDIVLYNALPFNVLKGLAISLITMLSYKSLRPILKGRETT